MLKLQIDQKTYRKNTILENVNIEIYKNGIYGFFGKNGQGKTTLFNCILGFTKFRGKIIFNDKEIKSSDIAWIPTEPELYEYLTINEFLDFYAINCYGKKVNRDKFLFNLDLSKLIKECSTGIKKKTYINSVLQFQEYKIYIFDEPFNGLDFESNYLLLNYIEKLSKTQIVLLSSHIIEILLPYLTHCYWIENKQITQLSTQKIIEKLIV